MAQTFDDIDTDHGGMILLIEWCDWLEKTEIAAGTPDGKLLGVGE